MKVVHIESGLGNQMLSYCEYLAMKQTNPEEPCYIEKIVYDIPEANDYICQWNGYELDRIFGIAAPDVMDTLSREQRETVMASVRASQFWLHEWNWPAYFPSGKRGFLWSTPGETLKRTDWSGRPASRAHRPCPTGSSRPARTPTSGGFTSSTWQNRSRRIWITSSTPAPRIS